MLRIDIPPIEGFDEEKNEFVILEKGLTIVLEHSLVSLSKWESNWCKPFLVDVKKTDEEMLDYIKCMTITQNVSDEVYYRLTEDNVKQIEDYINAPMSASTVPKIKGKKGARETVTSELIYYWMISLNIPFECQKWHLNRLLKLVDVCNFKNNPPKGNRSSHEIAKDYAALNKARRQKFNSRG